MKTFFFLIAIGISSTCHGQTDLLLLPKDSLPTKMSSGYISWEFDKQSEEFTNGVSYDLYEYKSKTKEAEDLTFLFDKNGICVRVMYINSLTNSNDLIEWADKNYRRAGKDTWVDNKTRSTIRGIIKRNESASTVSIEFVSLLYRPAL